MAEHPITPPPELVSDWCRQWARENDDGPTCVYDIATQAARWGGDQELEECCEWLNKQRWPALAIHLRDARRPKPPSLKEQALHAWAAVMAGTDDHADMAVIRRALEALDD